MLLAGGEHLGALVAAGQAEQRGVRGQRGLHQQPGAGARGEQGGQALGVDVVGVLVRDDDRVDLGDGVPVAAERPGVDQDAAPRGLDEQAGVTEVGDPHGLTVAPGRGTVHRSTRRR